MRSACLLLGCALALALGACGGGDDGGGRPDRAAVERGATAVVRGWVDALRKGDVERAAAFFAVPSQVQNGTPPITLRSRRDAVRFNEALPCGAVLTGARAHAGYLITRVRLTDRPGGDCGLGVGGTARNAIRVRHGKIVEWYRLPDDPGAPLPDPDGSTRHPELPVI